MILGSSWFFFGGLLAVLGGFCWFLFFFAGSRALLVIIGGSCWFLVVLNDFLVVLCGSWFFFVLDSSWLFLMVLGCS